MQQIIILAGGLGTRLRSVVPDLPKCMAPVNGKPFLAYVINYFQQQGIQNFIFSLGYKHEIRASSSKICCFVLIDAVIMLFILSIIRLLLCCPGC